MKTTKALVTTLFTLIILFIMFAVSMPVHADWDSYSDINKMTDKRTTSLYTIYENNNKKIVLGSFCGKNFFFSLFEPNLLGIEYEDDFSNNDLLIRFDKESAYNINVVRSGNTLWVSEDDFSFLSKIKKHQILLAEIYLWPNDYVIAEFDISGFDEAVEKYCGWFRWKTNIYISMDEPDIAFKYFYSTDNTGNISLGVSCERDTSGYRIEIASIDDNIIFGNQYGSEPSNLLVQFDEHDTFNIQVARFDDENLLRVKWGEPEEEFAKGLRDYRFLRMKIYTQSKSYSPYIIAKFNLAGFTETYNSHCG